MELTNEFSREDMNETEYGWNIVAEYALMNMDTNIADVTVSYKVRYGYQYKASRVSQDDELYNRIISTYGDITTFVTSRKPVKNREYLSDMLDMLQLQNGDDMTGYLDVSYGLSLNDTLWFKRVGSSVSWGDINLYENKFSDVIAHFAFTGEGLLGNKMKVTSPEYGTNGMLPKCWIRENGRVYLIKGGTSGASNTGREPYSEYYCSQVLEKMGIQDYVKYDLVMFKGRLASKCELFTSEEYGYMPAVAKCSSSSEVTALFDEFGLSEQLSEMLVFDSIVCNHDRHLNNFGFLIDNKSLSIKTNAPIFDNGYGLDPFYNGKTFDGLMEHVNKLSHVLYGEYITTAKEFLTPSTRKMCRNLINFKFTRHPLYNLPEERIQLLEQLVQHQVQEILR